MSEKPKVLKFKPKETVLTEDDIVNLFIGLIRLIKNNAVKEAESKFLKEINHLKSKLKEV